MKLKTCVIILFCSAFIYGQQTFDSISTSVVNADDTLKIKTYTDFAWNNRSKDPNEALRSAQEAVSLAEKSGHKKLEAKAFNIMGVVYRNLSRYEIALRTYNKALSIAQEVKDSTQIAYSFNNIGGIYRLEGNNTLALNNILKASDIFERMNNKAGLSYCTINIGIIYKRQENYTKALEYLDKTLNLRIDIGDKPGKALALNLIAETYFDMGEYSKSLNYYNEVEKEYREVNDKKGLAATWGGIAGVYKIDKNYQKALEYRLRAYKMSEEIDYVEGQVLNSIKTALLYQKLGDKKNADLYYAAAQKIMTVVQDVYVRMEGFKNIAEYFELKQDYKNAFHFLKEYQTVKDSITTSENVALVSEMEAIYSNERAIRSNELLYKDLELNKKQRNYFIVIAVLILLVALVAFYLYRIKKTDTEELKQVNTMKDTLLRIIAHDLKTPFNVIFGYTEILQSDFHNIKDKEKLMYLDSIRKASRISIQLLENLLMWSRSHSGKLDFKPAKLKLADSVRENLYVLEATAENKKIVLESNVPEDIYVEADENMLNTILRNLVSNGIKFTNENGRVAVSCVPEKEFVHIIVEDNGLGMDEITKDSLFNLEELASTEGTAGERGTGFGLVLCKEFVDRHKGKIWVESEMNKGSKFNFTLPSST